jgi:cysteine synthase A
MIIHENFVDALASPRIVWLRPNLVGIAFSLMKLLPARFILRRAEQEGEIGPGSLIAETTSGTFGLALAMVARLKSYRLALVTDPATEAPLQRRLEDLGATVHVLRKPAPFGGFQRARLDLLRSILSENPGSFWPRQYSNPCNPESYAQCAEDLVESIGAVDCLVGTVGSGGSVCGLSSYLRLLFPQMTVVGVDTHGSVLFGLPDAGAGRTLRGLGNSLVPPIVDHTTFDWVHWVGATEALRATRRLHQDHTLFMGPTSGAAYLVADWWARKNPSALVAVILPDEGHRYVDTVYDDTWLEKKGVSFSAALSAPVEWERPCDKTESWSCFRWRRRSYAVVMGRQPPALDWA